MSAFDHWKIANARKKRLKRGLRTLSSWAASRAIGDHDEQTTLSMLIRKVAELHNAVDEAGWQVSATAAESERDAACADKCRDKAAADRGWGNI